MGALNGKSVQVWGALPHLSRALLIQAGVLGVLWWVAQQLPRWVPPPYPLWAWVVAQGVLAAMISAWVHLPRWWVWIQLLLPLALGVALWLGVPLWAVALGLGVLWLVFRNALLEQVPLYLSNSTTRKALCQAAKTLPDPVKFLDLGCGLGGAVVSMARCPNVVHAAGVETAPLSLWIARWRARRVGAQVAGLSLWQVALNHYNLVYAFLSPAPMTRLQEKVLEEMPPQSLFVSNSFPLPDVPATEIWQLNDRRGTYLYLYRFDAQRRLVPPEEVDDERG